MAKENTTIQIKGMTCGHCERVVKNLLLEQAGVSLAEVSAVSATASVVFENTVNTRQALIKAINENGIYKAIQ